VNTDIISHFVASLIDIQVPKWKILRLTKAFFLKRYLGGLGEVVTNIVSRLGLLRSSNLRSHTEEDRVVPWEPFLSGFKKMNIDEHRKRAHCAYYFLMRSYEVEPIFDMTWYINLFM
jgi:hypothetical protein